MIQYNIMQKSVSTSKQPHPSFNNNHTDNNNATHIDGEQFKEGSGGL